MVTVLHIFSGDLWAGAEVMVFHLLGRLAEDRTLRIKALGLNEGVLTRKLRQAGIDTYVIPESRHTFPAIFMKARSLLRGWRIDIIHSHRYKENFLAWLLAGTLGKPRLLATVHGLRDGFQPQDPGASTILKNGGLAVRLNWFLLRRCFDRVVAVSQEMAETLVRRHGLSPEKLVVIHNGIPVPREVEAGFEASASEVHIGTVGRLVSVKDHALFIDTAAAIRCRSGRARFSILGDGPLRESLLGKAEEAGLDRALEFLRPRPDPWEYHRSLDIYLNTSIHEGMPLSLLEAMACGKPVVAPRVGGIPELITHGGEGLLVDSRDPEDFAAACLELMEAPERRKEMGRRAMEKVSSRFTSAAMAEAYRRIYQ